MRRWHVVRASLSSHPLAAGFYTPYLLLCVADSFLTPVLPVYAAQLGADYAGIGAVIGASAIGTMFGNIPASMIIRRLGSRRTFQVGILASTGLFLVALLAQSVAALIALRFVMGIVMATLNMSEHTYLSAAIDPRQRGKMIALFGGVTRGGFLIGPVVGGLLALRGGAGATFTAGALLYAIALAIVCAFLPDVDEKVKGIPGQKRWQRVVHEHGHTLLTAGIAQYLAQMVRAGRPLLIPLYAATVLHLDVATIGAVLSIGALFDLAMFTPAGYVMDRFGRKWAIIPSFAIHALGLVLIPFTQNVWGLSLVALVVGFGNGLGSGSMMTMATDLAPDDLRSEFISLWRLMGDFGTSTAPLIAGAIASALTLTPAIWVIGASGAVSILIFGLYVPETRPQDEKAKPMAETPQAAPEPR
jgi:MFS family permease